MIVSVAIQTQTEECVREGVTYRVETRWDDESGNAEIREFSIAGELVRRCDWRIWPENERLEDQIGDAIWFDASGTEIERRPLRAKDERSGCLREHRLRRRL